MSYAPKYNDEDDDEIFKGCPHCHIKQQHFVFSESLGV